MPKRKAVPKDIDRALYLEASGHCAFPRCGHELGLERRHIDGNCNNNNLENLLLLCPTHHQWATMGKIDQKTCRKIKSRLLAEYLISYAPREMTISLPTRRRFNDAVINAIEGDPKLLRARFYYFSPLAKQDVAEQIVAMAKIREIITRIVSSLWEYQSTVSFSPFSVIP